MRTLLSCCLLCILWTGSAFAAPAVSGTTGAITHGGSLVISGSDFGSKSPATPFWWDNAETPADTTVVAESGDIAGVTTTIAEGSRHYNDVWPAGVTQDAGVANLRYRAGPYRNVAVPHTRSTKFIAGGHDDEGECLGGEVGQNVGVTVSDGSSTADIWYVTYYHRLDPLWPTLSSENYKYMNWESVSPYTMYRGVGMANYDNVTACAGGYLGRRRCPACKADYMSAQIVLILDSTDCALATNSGYPVITHATDTPNPANGWVHAEYLLSNTANLYQSKHDNKLLVDSTATGGCTLGKGPFGGVTIGGFWRQGFCGDNQDDLNDDAWRYFDDIYVDNTFSRVMLCNASTYSAATICEPQIPSAWAASELTVTLNLGGLGVEGSAWLYVFDSANTASAGYAVTIGSTTGAAGVAARTSVTTSSSTTAITAGTPNALVQ